MIQSLENSYDYDNVEQQLYLVPIINTLLSFVKEGKLTTVNTGM